MTTASSETRTRRKRHLIISSIFIAAAALFLIVLAIGLTQDPKKIPSAQIGREALPFQVNWVQGREFLPTAGEDSLRLSDLRGKPVVLNFWASWCVSCRSEALELEAFWRQYKDEVLVVGIAIQDDKASALQFAQYYSKTYILGVDEKGKAAIDYGVSGVPETVLIDRHGIIRYKEAGPVTAAQLKQLLPKIL